VNEGLTLDFQTTGEAFPISHYCFRVSAAEFDAILRRLEAAGIKYRGDVQGPDDMKVGSYGNVYWNEPDGHYWEVLTTSYARP
jgi:predicted lactoylglutathione lyase